MKKKVFKLYVPAMVNQIEDWLYNEAALGWVLISKRGWGFTFEKSSPKHKEYFAYFSVDKTFGFDNDYYRAKEKYAKKKAPISKNSYEIFEIDLLKKDSDFYTYKKARDSYYKKHYLKLLIFSLAFVICSIATAIIYNSCFLTGLLLFFVLLLYSLISIVILGKTGKCSAIDKDKTNGQSGDGSLS